MAPAAILNITAIFYLGLIALVVGAAAYGVVVIIADIPAFIADMKAQRAHKRGVAAWKRANALGRFYLDRASEAEDMGDADRAARLRAMSNAWYASGLKAYKAATTGE